MIPRLKGTDDIFPPESRRWQMLLRTFDELAERFGYDFALLPVIESTELFARGVGEETDVVQKQMYTFDDQGGRSITLRPEFTAGMVRAYVESGASTVMKVATAGPNFRYEQPQKGRRRQFFQIDIEYLGEESPRADVEVIEFSYRLLEEVGVEAPTLMLNSIGDAGDRIAYRQTLQEYLRSVSLSDDSRKRIDTNPLRILDSKEDQEAVAGAPVPLDYLGAEARQHFDALRSGLEGVGVPFEIAPRLVRGLDYYNRTVFEFFSPAFEAAQAALGGGGRYDPLAEMIGSKQPVPAVGVAMGCDRIVDAMADRAGPRLDLFVVVADVSFEDLAARWLSGLRASGLRADWIGAGRSLRAQFKAADRSDARVAAVVGEEWNSGEVTVKELATGDEVRVKTEEVEDWLKSR